MLLQCRWQPTRPGAHFGSNPCDKDFDRLSRADLRQLVIAFQIHGFSTTSDPLANTRVHSKTCGKKGTKCRFFFPFKLVVQTTLDSDDGLVTKRNHPWVAAYNPWVLRAIRYNHNVQVLGCGADTYAAICYCINYAAKNSFDLPVILGTLA